MRGNPQSPAQKEDDDVSLKSVDDEVEELSGKLASNPDEERLMRTVLDNDEQAVEDGKLIADAVNQGVGSFTPDLMFKNLVQNYQSAKKLYGETIIRALTEYTPDYIKKNINIPEFRDALLQRIDENIEGMKERGLLDQHGFITTQGMKLASLILYTEELDSLVSKGLGHKELKERDHYGDKEDVVAFTRHKFRFKDVSLKQSVKTAIRRGHVKLEARDLKAYERSHKGRIQVIYAMDSSGSMRGEKIRMAKKAGIALSFRAIEERNEVGLVVFTSKVEKAIAPMRDFGVLLTELTTIRAGMETDLTKAILKSTELFGKHRGTKHLVILTDAVPTKGKDPRRETLEAVGVARDHGVTISVIGLSLDAEGEALAREVVEMGEGRLYRIKNLEDIDAVILQDYDAIGE